MLLTDGTDAGPGGVKAETVVAAPDASCPQVWFLARTGRIPPPEDSIKGPFRVSELRKMMQEGDLSPFDLVTATHAESYDDEEDESPIGSTGAVKEANIDTGKWKRIEQGRFVSIVSLSPLRAATILTMDIYIVSFSLATPMAALHGR